jgi:hypothetical protein
LAKIWWPSLKDARCGVTSLLMLWHTRWSNHRVTRY